MAPNVHLDMDDDVFALAGYKVVIDPERPPPDARRPAAGDAVTVTVTRGSAAPQTLSFTQSAGQAVPWLNATASLLHVGATASLVDPAGHAQTVTLEKHTIRDEAARARHTPGALRDAGTKQLRDAENARDLRGARLTYARSAAAAYADMNDAGQDEAAAAAHSNAALAALKASDNVFALVHAEAADAARGAASAKTAFRRARAYQALGLPVRAMQTIREAQRLAPDDAGVRQEVETIDAAWEKDVQSRRQGFAEVYNVKLNSVLLKDPLMLRQ